MNFSPFQFSCDLVHDYMLISFNVLVQAPLDLLSVSYKSI